MSELADKQRISSRSWATPGSGYDYLIRALRVILPSIVGVMLAVLIAGPFSNNRELSFVLDKKVVDRTQERMRITSAMYRGADSLGRPFSIKAGSAVQKSAAEPIVHLRDIDGEIMLSTGSASLIARDGQYDFNQENIRVNGPLSFNDGNGFALVVNNVLLALKDRTMQSFGAVNGKMALGTFRADSMHADLDGRTVTLSGHAQLRINQNVIK